MTILKARAMIFGGDPRRPWLAERSRRSLLAAGIDANAGGDGPCLLLKAGHVLRNPAGFRPPPGGGDIIGIGLPTTGAWRDFQAIHGGRYPKAEDLPEPVCEWHNCRKRALARLSGEVPAGDMPVVHWPPLDLAATGDSLFVMQVVTSPQHGGAETIARDLAEELPRAQVTSRLVVLGKPHRQALDLPPGTIDLSGIPSAHRAGRLVELAAALGVDVFHLHLTDADETRRISTSGIPVMVTVHNTRRGWPRGWDDLEAGDVALMVSCSMAVERELRQSLPAIPVRTVWNGIRPEAFPETPPPDRSDGFVIACVANPRPQKRLELLPGILVATCAELRARGVADPKVKLVIAGETSPALADASECRRMVDRQAAAHGVAAEIVWTEGRVPVREVLASAHALVSCSAHEGLSLAHLEGLSSGRPVVACDVGGTRELAWGNPALRLLDAGAGTDEFAKALADVLLAPPSSAHRWVWRDFTTGRMAERVARLARQVACRPQGPPRTLWFVTNNLSTGGAQSSLRRLTKALHVKGMRVRVALLQEYPDHPTAGRKDLLAQGIEVFVPPPNGIIGAEEAVDRILAEMAAAPPVAVVFWNAISLHKLLLADALPFTPVHDVSPGEMWFSSLESCLDKPSPGLPCRTVEDYGRLLSGMVVKYRAEAPRAAALGCRVAVIPNGVAVPEYPPRRLPNRGKLVFGAAARISPQKRLDELLDAFRLALPDLPPCVLRIAGGVETGADECAAELRRLADGLPVEWLGETGDVSAFHADCDVFVMISDPAGCPNASLEALAAGLPVIATDVGGASEQVVDGKNGLLVPARDVAGFARAMVHLASDTTRREAMGTAARDHIVARFSLERMTREYVGFLGLGP